jgi:hypothetical protein
MKKILILFLLLFPLSAGAYFDKNLYYGLQSDPQVNELQEFLAEQGLYSGPITGNFFSLTMKAVKSFQQREGISPISGFFGPLTRTRANEFLADNVGASNQQAVNETGSVPAPSEPAKTTNDVVGSLQAQIALLLQQIALLQTQTNTLQQTQQQVQQQTQQIEQQNQQIQQQQETINQIQQNTQQIAQNTAPKDNTAPIISNIGSNAENNYAVVSWTTNEPSISWVEYGTTSDCGNSTTLNSSLNSAYSVKLSNLKPGTTYYFKIISKDAQNNQGRSSSQSFITKSLPATITVTNNDPKDLMAAMGSTGQRVGYWTIKVDSKEGVTLTQIIVYNNNSVANSNVKNLKLYCNSEQFGQNVNNLTNGKAVFNGSCSVSKSGSVPIQLTADITPYSEGALRGEYVQFYITVPSSITGFSEDPIVAKGVSSGVYSLTSGVGNKISDKTYVYRTSLSASILCGDSNYLISCGYGSGAGRTYFGKIASLTFTNSIYSNAILKSITFYISGDFNSTTSASKIPFYLKTGGGEILATSYPEFYDNDSPYDFSMNGIIRFVPDSGIVINKPSITYNIITDTLRLMATSSPYNETIGLQMSTGKPSVAGGIQWQDYSDAPLINWIGGENPIQAYVSY